MPSSAMARMASGLTDVFSVPALPASKRAPAIARRKPSAMWLRAELCVQRNRTRGRLMSEQPLHDHAIAPLPVELAVPLVHADHPEAAPFVQAQARGVLGKDPGDDLPEAALGVGPAHGVQRGPTRAGTPRRARH